MLRIGEFSKLSSLSPDTLYHYESIGLLKPYKIDDATGYRYYEASQMLIVNKIFALKDAGFSLKEIAHIVTNGIEAAILIDMLDKKAGALEARLSEESDRLERLKTNIFLIKNGGIPYMNNISIKKVEPILVASIRKRFPKEKFDESLESMWSSLNNFIDECGVKKTVPCLMLYHTNWVDTTDLALEYDAVYLDTEVAEPVTKDFKGNGEVNVYKLEPSDKMACIVHKGPFTNMGETFDTLYSWMRRNGYKASGPVREIYHKGEWAADNPNEYITEIQIPLA